MNYGARIETRVNIAYERTYEYYKVEVKSTGLFVSEERLIQNEPYRNDIKIVTDYKIFSYLNECEFWVKVQKEHLGLVN